MLTRYIDEDTEVKLFHSVEDIRASAILDTRLPNLVICDDSKANQGTVIFGARQQSCTNEERALRASHGIIPQGSFEERLWPIGWWEGGRCPSSLQAHHWDLPSFRV